MAVALTGCWTASKGGWLPKTELKITEPQTAAWNQLADAIRTAAKHHNERMKAHLLPGSAIQVAPRTVEAQEQFISIRVEEIKRSRQPEEPLRRAVRRAKERGRRG